MADPGTDRPAFAASAGPAPSHLNGLVAGALFISALVTVVWMASGFGYFWPAWAWLGLSCPVALQAVRERTRRYPPGPSRRYALHEGLTALVAAVVLLVWLLAGLGPFWPIWPLGAGGALLALHWLLQRTVATPETAVLTDRVEALTESRAGALDVQAAELRRIERDLHDGAQARLVALTMQLGRAEQRLGEDVDEGTRALIRGAQEEARLAIAELRDLARGIAPPVLVDRGLAAAVEALGKRSPLEVDVQAQLERRPSPVVESAAYFVVAESLTNAAKHSPEAHVRISIVGDGRRLQLLIADDGVGGADPGGGGLVGLRQRVLALDGTLTVVSPRGHGTTITAELPCGS